MAKLTSKERNALPDSAFALPKQRKYPIMDPSHQKNAKARASQQEAKGHISESTKETIFRKADAKMHKGSKGHTGHDGKDGMVHMGTPHMHPQGAHKVGKHGKLMGQHPAGGTLSGLHHFANISHPNHKNKMEEG